MGVVSVPDERLDKLAALYNSKKITLRDVIWDLQYNAVPTANKNYHNLSIVNLPNIAFY